MATRDWILRTDDDRLFRFRSLYECIDYAESNGLVGCEITGPRLTTKENVEQLNTVKQYFTIDCGHNVH
jgi:hypothetical protein